MKWPVGYHELVVGQKAFFFNFLLSSLFFFFLAMNPRANFIFFQRHHLTSLHLRKHAKDMRPYFWCSCSKVLSVNVSMHWSVGSKAVSQGLILKAHRTNCFYTLLCVLWTDQVPLLLQYFLTILLGLEGSSTYLLCSFGLGNCQTLYSVSTLQLFFGPGGM